MTFVLRLSVDDTGRVCGVLERVRTGEKRRFYGLEEMGSLIARMVRTEAGAEATGERGLKGEHS